MNPFNRIKPVLVAVSVFAAFSGTASAAGEVKFIKGGSVVSSYRGVTWQRDQFEALVSNLSYAKQVSIYYKTTDNQWFEYPLSYNRTVAGGKEVWTSSSNGYLGSATDPIEFAVKYQVNGQTYWDNNNGSNYRLKKNGGNILSGVAVYNSYNAQFYASTGTVFGSATVANLSPNKQVTVIYSTDGWKTTQQVDAYFNPYFWFGQYTSIPNPNTQGYEEWTYQLNVGNAAQVEYAIKYTVNGSTYWDNNFGSNYVSQIVR